MVLGVDLDGVRVVGIAERGSCGTYISVLRHPSSRTSRARDSQLDLGLLLQSILGDRLERLFDIDGLLGRGLKVRNVALGLTPRHGPFLGDHAFRVFHVDLVPEDDKGEVFRVVRAGLYVIGVEIKSKTIPNQIPCARGESYQACKEL